MKRAAGIVFAAILASSLTSSLTYYAVEVRGGSRIYSVDLPIRKGRLLLFHRYPDGVYMSLPAEEVERIVASETAPRMEKLAPGETMFIGPAIEGPSYEASNLQPSAPPDMVVDSGYGYGGMWWGGGFPLPPPLPPPIRAPSNIGANGFPILAPPGSPGSAPPRIGPNGYPILAPPPPVPRRP